MAQGLSAWMLQPSQRHRAAQGTPAMTGVETASHQLCGAAGPSPLPPIFCLLGSGAEMCLCQESTAWVFLLLRS